MTSTTIKTVFMEMNQSLLILKVSQSLPCAQKSQPVLNFTACLHCVGRACSSRSVFNILTLTKEAVGLISDSTGMSEILG